MMTRHEFVRKWLRDSDWGGQLPEAMMTDLNDVIRDELTGIRQSTIEDCVVILERMLPVSGDEGDTGSEYVNDAIIQAVRRIGTTDKGKGVIA